MSVLDIPLVVRTRRNHALEHATIHVLAQHQPGLNLVGRSTPYGYYIYGQVTLEQVRAAAQEALARLKAGEHRLAIHPGCGTNLVTSSMLAGAGTFVAMGGRNKRWQWDQLPTALLGAMVGLALAQPLGPAIQQRITTCREVNTLVITDVKNVSQGSLVAYKISTRS